MGSKRKLKIILKKQRSKIALDTETNRTIPCVGKITKILNHQQMKLVMVTISYHQERTHQFCTMIFIFV